MVRALPFILLSCCIILGLSCKKSRLNKDTSIAEDNALAQWLWNDIGNQVEGSSTSNEVMGSGANKWNNCATVTIDSHSSTYPLTVTLDFGEGGCKGFDGRIRRGKLIYAISGPYAEPGTTITVASNDYYVNDYRIEGSRIVKNEGPDGLGRLQFSVLVTDAVITTPDQKTITWEATHTRTWIEGSETGFLTETGEGTIMGIDGLLDDVYEVTGSGSGTNRDGRAFHMEVISPLRLEFGCRWITGGEIRISPENLDPRTLDYGNGECDNEATVIIDSKEYTIELRG